MTKPRGPDTSEDDRLLLALSGLFDSETYLRDNHEARGKDPIEHYLTEGWIAEADPGPNFSTQHYLRTNPDVCRAGVNPLVHYIRHGRDEGREPMPLRNKGSAAPAAVAPTEEEWDRLARKWRPPSEEPTVDVLVPVYRGFDETLRCLYSVLAASQLTPHQLVVVDDHGPDPELRRALRRLAGHGWIELHATPENLGFVGACNLGIQLHSSRDFVLLNSDTEVHNDWLDRLRSAALRDPRTGTVTPFSNNAEICSYPLFVRDNWRALEVLDAELDSLAARVNAAAYMEIPTGVGFCMYVRRACLNKVGLLDRDNFGRGYGEENDFCRRIAAAGWRNILAANVFVRHHGAASFGSSKVDRVNEALRTVERLHPGYLNLISEFVRQDPLRPARAALDMARLAHRASRRGAVLFVTHNCGGGTERHVQELAQLLEAEEVAVFFCRADPRDGSRLVVGDAAITETPNLPSFDIARDVGYFAEALGRMGVSHVHVHHLAGLSERAPDFIRLACRFAGLAYDVTLHDYMAICPRINLIDGSGVYCGEPDLPRCEACIARNGSPFGQPSVWEWRDRYARLLAGARRVFVPDADVARRMRRHMPGILFHVRPHPERRVFTEDSAAGRRARRPPQTNTGRRIVLIGAIGPHKGSQLLLDCARAALDRALPLEFLVLGYTDRDAEFAHLPNVSVTGRYAEEELQERLTKINGDAAWFPALCPETYSYTLSAALAARLFPVAFDFGAIASRVRAVGWGELMPLEWMLHPDRVVDRFAYMPLPPPPDTKLLSAAAYPSVLASYYGLVGHTDDQANPTAEGCVLPLLGDKPNGLWRGGSVLGQLHGVPGHDQAESRADGEDRSGKRRDHRPTDAGGHDGGGNQHPSLDRLHFAGRRRSRADSHLG